MEKICDLLFLGPIIRTTKVLHADLKGYSLLLAVALEACEMWEEKKFACFDPLVGENACQIRTIQIALLAMQGDLGVVKLKKQIARAKENTDLLIDHFQNESGKSLLSLLSERGLNVDINKDQKFIFQAYLLSIAKILLPSNPETPLLRNDRAAPMELMRYGNVTNMFVRNLVIRTRQQLSADSVQFIHKKAIQVGNRVAEKMSSGDFVLKTDGYVRCCIPCFWSFQVFVSLIAIHKIPIVVHCWLKAMDQKYKDVGQVYLFFKPDDAGSYRHAIAGPNELEKPSIIIEGCRPRLSAALENEEEIIHDLQTYDILDVVLAYAASHRQYPDESNDPLVEALHDSEYEKYKRLGEEWGCSLKNPHHFLLNHIYCSSLSNVRRGPRLGCEAIVHSCDPVGVPR